MNRRTVLQAGAGIAGSIGLAGCGLLETEQQSTRAPPLVENRPDAVYYPTHVEGMDMVGMESTGDYQIAAMYSFPHRFWTVTGRDTSKQSIEDGDTVHMMATVWDPDTGIVLPETNLDIELTIDGELVSQEVVYPMLSQPMGFHYGDNFSTGDNGDGTYDVSITVSAIGDESGVRKTGAFRDRFTEPGSVDLAFEYSRTERDTLNFEMLDDAGDSKAVDPMEMEMVPNSLAPAESDLPGEVRATESTGDLDLVLSVLDSPPAGVDADGQYLAVSARTPYNRMIVPMMGLSATLVRDGNEVYAGDLVRTLDPDLNYHYGVAVDSIRSGDRLTLSVDTPPQVARHEGYETAFLTMPDVEVTL